MHGRACKQYIFRFSAMRFDENPFTCQCKKKKKKKKTKTKGYSFIFRTFSGSFKLHGSEAADVLQTVHPVFKCVSFD